MLRTALALLLTVTVLPALGAENGELTIPRLNSAPALEDFLSMAPTPEFEGMARVNGGFIQRDPVDGDPASQHTDVYLGYDDQNLYVVFVAFDDEPDKIRSHLSRRDNVHGDDIVEIQIDTFLDHRQAYTFLTNPAGVHWDAIWNEGGDFDRSWDTVWQARGKLTDSGYVASLTIPFKSLRFPDTEEQRWGFLLVRDIPRNNESSFYPQMTRRVQSRLAQEGVLSGIRGISPGRNAQINPYATARSFRLADGDNAVTGDFIRDQEFDGGLDAKMVFKDAMVLDLTANPDFSQVESDDPQITVNERFELFYPEKRPFFLENADYFRTPVNLLFTRRIVDPRAGARLTGKTGPHNLGVLFIDDEAPGRLDGTGRSAKVGALRYSRDIGLQSRIGALVTDRELADGYNRVASLDTRIKLGPNWLFSGQAATSSTRREGETSTTSGQLFDAKVDRSGRHLGNHSHINWVDSGFRTDLGFVSRVGIMNAHHKSSWTFWPEGKRLISWTPAAFVMTIEDTDGLRLDNHAEAEVDFQFRNQTQLELNCSTGRQRLRAQDHSELTEARDYPVDNCRVEFGTRFSSRLQAELSYDSGQVVNFAPPSGMEPFQADRSGWEAEISLLPVSPLRIDLTFISRKLDDPAGRG
ncbi:MAG: carbohydrate binding family 9 domain-containing protein, partial [Acidobacteria bacterium]|nr:carbohydrate binding family 9 domain-containing protein [Candidatus Polarisedimenticola svalbardensis]